MTDKEAAELEKLRKLLNELRKYITGHCLPHADADQGPTSQVWTLIKKLSANIVI